MRRHVSGRIHPARLHEYKLKLACSAISDNVHEVCMKSDFISMKVTCPTSLFLLDLSKCKEVSSDSSDFGFRNNFQST